jgi:hypothetical protein
VAATAGNPIHGSTVVSMVAVVTVKAAGDVLEVGAAMVPLIDQPSL